MAFPKSGVHLWFNHLRSRKHKVMSSKKGFRSPALGEERTVMKDRARAGEVFLLGRVILEQERGLENRSAIPRLTFQPPDHIIT